MAFEADVGQTDPRVAFTAAGSRYFLRASGSPGHTGLTGDFYVVVRVVVDG